MGNREDLLAGAKRCLIEKGYAATTARDIAAASGVSLAAIGYHFGSKDALMNQAVFDSVGDWATELQEALAAEGVAGSQPLDALRAVMRQTLESFAGPGSAACGTRSSSSSHWLSATRSCADSWRASRNSPAPAWLSYSSAWILAPSQTRRGRRASSCMRCSSD